MGSLGHTVVCTAMILSASGGALLMGGSPDSAARAAGRRLLLAAAVAAVVSLLVLVFLLLNHDYRIAYVHEYANRNMSIGYLVTAVWGGQQGSLLLWGVLQAGYTAAVVYAGGDERPLAVGFLSALQTYFFALVLFHSNPFESSGAITTDGIGMNPLLLNPYMAIHPPALFLGYVGVSVPFAFALEALASGRALDEWILAARPWTLLSWLFLSIGNLLGMIWAYQELGWGGYWGWDPVENAAFMPWLTATALLHTGKKQGLFPLLSPVLALLSFVLVIFGTFITRSGVIQSVHAFSGATIGPYLLCLIIFCIALFVSLLLLRRRDLKAEATSAGLLSKESLFQITAWILLTSTTFIWIGTMAPLFTELLKGEKVASTPAFFNRWMAPLGLMLLAALGVCLVVNRQRRSAETTLRRWPLFIRELALPLGACALAGLAGFLFLGFRGVLPLISFGLLGFVASLILKELGRIARRSRDETGLSSSRRRRLGALVVHLSTVLLFLGFTGGAFTVEKSGILVPGQSMRIGAFDLEFKGLREDSDYLRDAIYADVEATRHGEPLGLFSAARQFYHSHPEQPTSEVAIRTGLFEDLFLILGNIDEAKGSAVIRVLVNPMVLWIWVGGLMLVLGTMVSLGPPLLPPHRFAKTVLGRRHLMWAGLGIAFIAAFVLLYDIAGPAMAMALAIGMGLFSTIALLGKALFGIAEGERVT